MVNRLRQILRLAGPKNVVTPPPTNALAPTTRPDSNITPLNPNTGRRPFANSPFPSAAGAYVGAPQGSTGADGSAGFDAAQKISLDAIGNSGTQIFGGYFSEEYLSSLRGRLGAKKWDEMRRSEAQIAMLLNAITNPIKAANWDFDAYDATDSEMVKHKEFVEMVLKEQIDFQTFVHEGLTLIPFGFSLFEIVHNVIENHPKYGTFNGLKSIAFRSQKTIENWMLEAKTGRLLGVNQYTYSDLGGNQFIPGDFLLVFTHNKEGDNYEGISALRPMLGAYTRKDLYLKLTAIGIEKYAVGAVIGTVPVGKERSPEFETFKEILQNYTSHESAYIVKPAGWEVEIMKNDFDAGKMKEILSFENSEMVNALVANFLALGMNGSGGAYALGSNLGEFFTTGIQSYADLMCDGVNRMLIPSLIRMNFGPQAGYPKMKCSGISDKAGKELAETVKLLADARALDPDMPLKEFIRKQYRMPKPDPTTAVPLPQVPAGASANYPKAGEPVTDPSKQADQAQLSESVKTIKLADSKYIKQFDANKDGLKDLMKNNLTILYGNLKNALRSKYKALKGSDKILAAKGVSTPGLNNYKNVLKEYLADIAGQSIDAAKKQVKLNESFVTLKLADKYDALPKNIRNLVDIQASLISETQAADIEKHVFFSFTTAATVTDDIDEILNAVDESIDPQLEGELTVGMNIDAAAGDAVAHITQQSSLSFLFEDDVLDGIESFTFTNEDPVSDICTELAGTTFAPGDPDLDAYTPPLHHNCKSRLVPNLKGDSDNPDIDRGGVSLSKKALKSMTLGEFKLVHKGKRK